ncbi:Ubiquitin-conjugating enzyme E2 W-like [Oopsacas minuta]|uniref:Ubiquitin-conjugating enzyme E2 W-like n=1 Tax=Oopsacas minuta TaxID=111878 RepID=A0AAV7JSS9_9METZ|nr:Ubiquitin-conjugating enzyme E2 W-like [Oopsacas minuta]
MGCVESKTTKSKSKSLPKCYNRDSVKETTPIEIIVDKQTSSARTKEVTDISKLQGKQRIIRELKHLTEDAPSNMRMDPSFDGSNLKEWIVDMDGAVETIYNGEKFKLKIIFNENYPSKAPTITFIPGHVPMHPHIYSNGHMCLEILYEGYRPEMTIVYICNCIMLMLDCNTKKEWPYNDSWYLRMNISHPNHGMWAWEEYY